MLAFSELHSDYPLNFTLFRCLYMGSLKHPFGAIVLSSESAHFLPLIGDNVSFFACVSVHARPSYSRDVAACDCNRRCFPPESDMRLRAQCCSRERNPSARQSTPRLLQATPSAAPMWNCPVEQFAHPAGHRRTHLRGNGGPDFRELTAPLSLHKSAGCVVVDLSILSTLLRYSHENLAHWLFCLGAHRRIGCEISSNELTALLPFSQPPACDVLDGDTVAIPQLQSCSAAVLVEGYESAGTVHETWTRCRWLSLDGLPSFECLIFERSGLELVIGGSCASAFACPVRGEGLTAWRADAFPVPTSLLRPEASQG